MNETKRKILTFALTFAMMFSMTTVVSVVASGSIEVAEDTTPNIQFSMDDDANTLTVTYTDPSVLWSNFYINGDCDTSNLGTNITVGDVITDCYGAITITHLQDPQNSILYSWTFSEKYPDITFSYDSEQGIITITSVDPGYYYNDGTSATSSVGANLVFVKDDDEFFHYVLRDLTLGTSGILSTAEISVGDDISLPPSAGTWKVFWKPRGSGYVYFSFTVSGSSIHPDIKFSYNSLQNTLTITSIDPGYYYSDSLNPSDANLVFERNKPYNKEYVLSDLTVGTYGELSTKEIKAGDVLSGFTIGTYTIKWEPTGEEIGTFTVYSSEEGTQLLISVSLNNRRDGALNLGNAGVIEGSSFSVQISYDDPDSGRRPAKDATVIFLGQEYQTNANGERDGWITLIAPMVEEDTEYSISAIKDGYKSAKKYFTVVNDPDAAYGWVYGTVLLRSGDTTIPADGAMITVGESSGDIGTFEAVPINEKSGELTENDVVEIYFVSNPVYTQANENGEFSVSSLLTGTYVVEALHTKKYHSKEFIEVKENEGTEVNLIIDITETRLEIERSIRTGNVGAELIIQDEENAEFEHDILIYDGVEIDLILINRENISIIVNGDENGPGKTIAITTGLDLFSSINDLVVKYDGELIQMADDIEDVLNPNDDGIHAEYLITKGTEGIEILLSIPHFSEHEITISGFQPEGAVEDLVETVGGFTAFVTYISICIIAGVLFVGAIFVRRKI